MKISVVSFAAIFCCIFIVACVTPGKYRHESQRPILDAEIRSAIGDEFFRNELMYGDDNGFGSVHNGEAIMFTLTIVALNEKTLSLQYNEYIKQMHGPARGFRPESPWLIRDKYSQRYDYELFSGTIKFKSFAFQVIGVKDGAITYKRTM